jgi:hypothetical protein
MTAAFSPREFLRSRNAALVHFSTLMTSRPHLTFPNDMRQAMTLKGVPLSFSTIQPGDSNPHMVGERGGAEGSVGMIDRHTLCLAERQRRQRGRVARAIPHGGKLRCQHRSARDEQ